MEIARMNLHKNARTCPSSRVLMVKRVLQAKRPVAEVANEFGVSRSTVYKWINRYLETDGAELRDRLSCPHEILHRLGRDWIELIPHLRRAYRMTALRIANQPGG